MPLTDVAIVGIGRTSFTRDSGRTTGAMAAEATRAALRDAGLGAADVDGMASYQAGDSTLTPAVAQAIGVQDLAWSVDLFGGGNAVVSCIGEAARAILAGSCDVAVVYRSMNGRSGRRFGTATGEGGLNLGGESQFGGPVGYLVPPHWMAMWTARHQYVYGSTCEDLGAIAVTQREHAVANAHAIARAPIDLDQYLSGRWVVEPLRVFDCAYEVDGAVALVLTSLERARDLPHPPVQIVAAVDSTSAGGSWDQWPDPTEMFSARLAPRLWDRSGLSTTDIDVACIYDCFTFTVMAVLEDLGFAEKGAVGDFFRSGQATYGGAVVVNPHGGLLSEGYLHGMNHHYEAVLQLRGNAGPRQVADARQALVTAGAGPYGGAAIYRRGHGG